VALKLLMENVLGEGIKRIEIKKNGRSHLHTVEGLRGANEKRFRGKEKRLKLGPQVVENAVTINRPVVLRDGVAAGGEKSVSGQKKKRPA